MSLRHPPNTSGAPVDAEYYVASSNDILSNEIVVSDLSSITPNSDYKNSVRLATTIPTVLLGLPESWKYQDIGSPSLSGSSSFNSGTFTVIGAGNDIWGGNDQFQYCYQQVIGDCDISAHVTSMQNTNEFAKFGVMIRQSTDDNAKNAFTIFAANHNGGSIIAQYRTTTGADTSDVQTLSSLGSGYYIRLKRIGNDFTFYHSSDGITWISFASQTISMSDPVLVGLAMTSHAGGSTNTGTMTTVQVSGNLAAPSGANLTSSGTYSIDLTPVVVGDRILAKNQTNAATNGIYTVSTSTWNRASDADSSAKVTAGLHVYVEEGVTYAEQRFILTTTNITLGSTNLSFDIDGSSSSAAGDTGEIQFNDGFVGFAASDRLVWDNTNKWLKTFSSNGDNGEFRLGHYAFGGSSNYSLADIRNDAGNGGVGLRFWSGSIVSTGSSDQLGYFLTRNNGSKFQIGATRSNAVLEFITGASETLRLSIQDGQAIRFLESGNDLGTIGKYYSNQWYMHRMFADSVGGGGYQIFETDGTTELARVLARREGGSNSHVQIGAQKNGWPIKFSTGTGEATRVTISDSSTNIANQLQVGPSSYTGSESRIIITPTNGGYTGLRIFAESNNAYEAPFINLSRVRGSVGSPSAVQADDICMDIGGSGWDGSGQQTSATMVTVVDGSVSSGNVPMRFSIRTGTNDGNRAERLRIHADGRVIIPNSDAAVIPFSVVGASSQSANLAQWRDVSDNVLARVKSTGEINAPGLSVCISATSGTFGNVTTGEDDLMSYTLAGGTLANTNDALKIEAFGTYASNGDNKNVKLYFGTDQLFTTGAVAINGGSWRLEATVFRIDGTNQLAIAHYNGDVLVTQEASVSSPTRTLSGNITIKVTGEGTNTSDIVQKGLIITKIFAPA